MTTLILASKADSASLTLRLALIAAHKWESTSSPLGELLVNTEMDAHMLLVDGLHVKSDNIGKMHMDSVDKNI